MEPDDQQPKPKPSGSRMPPQPPIRTAVGCSGGEGPDTHVRVIGKDGRQLIYGESRINEHNGIQRDGTLIGRDPKTMRGNRQNGISDENMPKYENVGSKPKIKC